MKIRRYAYITATELYELEITEELVKSYNEYIRNNYTLPEGFVDLTVQDVIDIYSDNSERSNEEITLTKWDYKCPLREVVEEFVSEDLWDSYVEVTDHDTDDWDDEVVED